MRCGTDSQVTRLRHSQDLSASSADTLWLAIDLRLADTRLARPQRRQSREAALENWKDRLAAMCWPAAGQCHWLLSGWLQLLTQPLDAEQLPAEPLRTCNPCQLLRLGQRR